MFSCERANTAVNAKQKVRIKAVLMPFILLTRIVEASKRDSPKECHYLLKLLSPRKILLAKN